MKQFFPFILIALIVGGAMFFLNDSYEEASTEYDPYSSDEQWSQHWAATFFLEESSEEGIPNIGVHLELERNDIEVGAVEFFVNTQYGSFFYQDLDIEEFDGVITYSELCEFCGNVESLSFTGDMVMNWKQDGSVRTEYFHFSLPVDGN